MTPLYINFIKKQPVNYLRLIAGIAMIAATIYLGFFSSQVRFKPFHLILFSAAGLYYAIMGAGINPIKALTKAYLLLDENKFELKPSPFKKVETANWNDIDSIQLNITSIRLKLKKGNSIQFEYQHLDTDDIHELRTTLTLIAKSKDVEVG